MTAITSPTRLRRAVAGALATFALAGVVAGCGGSHHISGKRVAVAVGHSPAGGVVVLAPVYINGHGPFRFIVDTGASKSVIDQALAQRLGFTVQPTHQALTGVNASQSAGRIVVKRWRIGKVTLPGQPLLTLSLAADKRGGGLAGLIGSDNLSRFGSFLLDYSHGVLILHAR